MYRGGMMEKVGGKNKRKISFYTLSIVMISVGGIIASIQFMFIG